MSQTRKPSKLLLLATCLALLSVLTGVGMFKLMELRDQPGFRSLLALPQAKVVADFALLDQSAQPFSLAGFKGRWSVLFFGFTSCPDICPNTLYQLQQVRKELAGQLAAQDVPGIYLVSVDPERDSPEKLAEYLSFFDPAFRGLTGDDKQLRALTMQLGIVYHVAEHDAGSAEYTVDHSASLVVLDPQTRLYGVFPAPHDPANISHDLLQLLD
jgi:protein SCO1/2